MLEGLDFPNFDRFSLEEISSRIKKLEFRENFTLSDGTHIYEGYINKSNEKMAHFCRFKTFEQSEICKMERQDKENNQKNDEVSKYSLKIEITEKEIDSSNGHPLAYYAGFWLSNSIFKGLKIFPGARKVNIGTFIKQSSPFSKIKTQKLRLNGQGISIVILENSNTVEIITGTFLYGMEHSYDPNTYNIPRETNEMG